LESLGVSLQRVRQQVEEIIGQGQEAPGGHIPFTPRAKKVLELSLREALQLGHNYIGTEHILLGLIREGEGVAAQVLVKLGADLNRVRQQVLALLAGQGKEPGGPSGKGETAPSSSPVLDQFGYGRPLLALGGAACWAVTLGWGGTEGRRGRPWRRRVAIRCGRHPLSGPRGALFGMRGWVRR
jgi:ATP-dependent Clp protease ATP-binding subunit ClpA